MANDRLPQLKTQVVLVHDMAEDYGGEQLLATEDAGVVESCDKGLRCYADEVVFVKKVVLWNTAKVSGQVKDSVADFQTYFVQVMVYRNLWIRLELGVRELEGAAAYCKLVRCFAVEMSPGQNDGDRFVELKECAHGQH